MTSHWQAAAEAELGVKLVSLSQLGGGDFASSYCATVQDGRKLFIKTHSNPPPAFFLTESTGLRWLTESGTVNIPDVLGSSDSPPYLALQWIMQGSGRRSTESDFGRQLAALHAITQTSFGRSDGATTGSLAVPNKQHSQWSQFFASQRLIPLIDRAARSDALPVRDLRAVEKVTERLEDFNVPVEPPSLLHGDLWAGNRLVDDQGRSWLIDPAVHCGHREFDLGMMALFGGYGDDCFAAYHEVNPLVPGWESRLPLHQLAPLLVHAIKFGGSYVGAVRAVLKQFA